VFDLWDGMNLKCTFRRSVDERLFSLWEEIVSLASTVEFSEEEDSMIWIFSSNGIYSSQSLYRVINNRGVLPVYEPSVWKLHIPPRVQFFLWLITKNRLLTRDNLRKRKRIDDMSCLMCCEQESTNHLLFECCVSQQIWIDYNDVFEWNIGSNYMNVAVKWLSDKKICTL
jgi:hypothetical protein